MVLRNMPGSDAAKRQQNINDSVARAREALAMDGKDGKCWCMTHRRCAARLLLYS
jgi:hypothetical protein